LLTVLLAPYDDQGAFSGRVRVAVPRMGIGERSAAALAMIIHELATNSVKYGALSSEAGSLDISSTAEHDMLTLIWAETGGPAITEEPVLKGFGSNVMLRSVSRQLGGTISYDWQPTGLVTELRLRRALLAA
jgi:two-component sensor histidine kinase